MATKNIARTAIEGGRTARCRYGERLAHRRERRAATAACHRALRDPGGLDELTVDPRCPSPDGREFADKLSPVRRWLDAQVGRRWDDVYADICRRFNNRTLTGRHVVGHIYQYVNVFQEAPHVSWVYPADGGPRFPWTSWSYDFEIDGHGVLRRAPRARRR